MKEEKKKKHKDEEGKKRMSEIDSPSSTPQPSGSKGRAYIPMSERQQFALIKQMETEEGGSSTGLSRSSGSGEQQHIFDKKLNKRNFTGETMLIQMAKKGDLAAVRNLVQDGANINDQDHAGWTGLHESCIRNFPRVTRYLLRHGANVHLRGLHGDTALHDATKNASALVIRSLLRYGANPYSANDKGERPIDLSPNEEITALLRRGVSKEEEQDMESSSSGSGEEELVDVKKEEEEVGSYSTEGGARSPARPSSDLFKRALIESATTRVKDPYAFEDDEADDFTKGDDPSSPVLQTPIKLRLNKEGHYTVTEEKEKMDELASVSEEKPGPVTNQSASRPTGVGPVEEVKFEELEASEDEEDTEDPGDAVSSSAGDPEPPGGSDPTTSGAADSEEGMADQTTDSELQKVPPLRIKLPGGEKQTSESSTEGTGPTLPVGQGPGEEGPASPTESTGQKDPLGKGPDDQQQTSSSTRQRTGRTLRSHTAAQREKEEKVKTDAPIKKRKLRSRIEQSDLPLPGTSSQSVVGDGPKEKSTRTEPPENPYEKAALLNKQMMEIVSRLVEIQPKAPNGYQDYLLVTRKYLLADGVNAAIKKRTAPKDLVAQPELVELYREQEEDRYAQALKHQAEREHLRLCAEQEVIRAHTRAALAIASQNRPFSFCSVIAHKDYTYIPPIKGLDGSIKEEESVRDRFTIRTFYGWLKDTKDKYEKEKTKQLCRQLHESESLMMVQKLDWEMKLKELLIHDFRADIFKTISPEHVPLSEVPNDFPLFIHDPVQRITLGYPMGP